MGWGGARAVAADLSEITRVFKDRYWTGWQENRCGENVRDLVTLLAKMRVNLDRALVVQIGDERNAFGMISGYRARESGPLIRPARVQAPFREPGKANWHHHVFFMAQETRVESAEYGKVAVFDMSFESVPTVVGISEYLDRMYLPDGVRASPENRVRFLSGFKLRILDAFIYVDRGQASATLVDSGWLREVFPAYFQEWSTNDSLFYQGLR